jgi:hypothetical protein
LHDQDGGFRRNITRDFPTTIKQIWRYLVDMIVRLLVLLSVSACARWDDGEPECMPDRAPVARTAITATAVRAAPTTTGFVLRLGGVQQRIRIGDVDLAAAQGWHWALVRTDAALQTLDWLELDDQGPPGEALIVSAGDVVFSETRNNFNFQASVSRIGAGLAPEWTFPTRILLDEFSRGMAASSTALAHVYTPSTSTADRRLELLDAADGSPIWDVPISQDFSDLAFDLDGNVIVTGWSAASRVARSDGSMTPLLAFTSQPTRVEATPSGFLMVRFDPAPALYAYDAAWSERWRLALGEPTPSTQLQLRALANGDALVLITDQTLGGTLARVDSGGVVTSTQHVCARTLLGVDATDRALLVGNDSDELLLQPTL